MGLTVATALVATLVLVGAVGLMVLATRRQRRRAAARDELIGAQWDAVMRRCTARNGAELMSRGSALVYVTSVDQYARTGSKTRLTWLGDGHQQDAWFWEWHVRPGWFLELKVVNRPTSRRTGHGWGEHNSNPDVLYLEHQVIVATYPETVHRPGRG